MLPTLCDIAIEAGHAIMAVRGNLQQIEQKADKSPVTEADHAANAVIVAALAKHWPDIPVVSEEVAASHAIDARNFWLVDPLDGTRGFIRGEDEFTVNIALIEDLRPVLGVIYLPAKEALYFGQSGKSAFRRLASENASPIATRMASPEGWSVVMSKDHASPKLDGFLMDILGPTPVSERVAASSSCKFCRVAEGEADLYPRLGPTMEWDTAAGQAIVEAAGGRVTTLDGRVFSYGKAGYRNDGFVVWGR